MKIRIDSKGNEYYITVKDETFLIDFSNKINKSKYKTDNYKFLKESILYCYNNLKSKNHYPYEIVSLNNNKDFDLILFVTLSYSLFTNLFCQFIRHIIQVYMKDFNVDYNDFWTRNFNRNWLYKVKRKSIIYSIVKLIENIFNDERKEFIQSSDCIMYKSENYTPHLPLWNFKCKSKHYKNIYFRIGSKDISDISLSNILFKKLVSEIKLSFHEKKELSFESQKAGILGLVIHIIVLFFFTDFIRYLKYQVNYLIESFMIVNSSNMKNRIFPNLNRKVLNTILSVNRDGNNKNQTKVSFTSTYYKQFSDVFLKEVEKGNQKQILLIDKLNLMQLKKQKPNVWYYFYLQSNNLMRAKIDFSPYENQEILREIKIYIAWLIKSNSYTPAKYNDIKMFLNFSENFCQKKIISAKFITIDIVTKFVNHLMSNEEISDKTYLSISTRKLVFIHVKKWFTFLTTNDVMSFSTEDNPFNKIHFKSIEKFKKNTLPLPEEVYFQILKYINNVDSIFKSIFIVLSATGLRWSEVINLKKDCLFKKNDIWFLKAVDYKSQKMNLKKGKSIYRVIPIYDKNVIDVIQQQMQNSSKNTDELHGDYIFMKRNTSFVSKSYSLPSLYYFNEVINSIIKKYDIRTNQNELWKYSSHQMRVRIATLMAESGFESQEITSFLNHSTQQTIQYAYAFVRKKRMAELNTKFFQEHFNSLVSEKNLKSLNKKERDNLYVNLCLNYRQMEYGKCVIPMSAGECGKLQEAKHCIQCQYLITSKDYIVKWKEFYENQLDRVEKLKKYYKKNDISIEEYLTFKEYQREKELLDAYIDVLDKLRKDECGTGELG